MQDDLIKHIAEEAGDIYSSWRWDAPDAPGSARVRTLTERVRQPVALATCRESDAGRYVLTVLELYEEALNDDWMPEEIAGLPLDAARVFIQLVAEYLQSNEPDAAIKILRGRYNQLINE